MLCGIGCQFMEDHAQRSSLSGFQLELRAFTDLYPLPIRHHQLFEQPLQISLLIAKKRELSLGKSVDPAK